MIRNRTTPARGSQGIRPGCPGLLRVWIVAVGLVFVGTGPAFGSGTEQTAHSFPFRYYPNRGGDFALTDQQGRAWSLTSQRGKVVLLTFGYTQCPDICPMTLTRLAAAWRMLGLDGDNVQSVFVTLDPERDTAPRLAAYLDNIESRAIGLTGSQDAVRVVARQYHVKYEMRDGGPGIGTLVDHSAFVYLIDRQGRIRYLFPHTTPPEQLADAASQLLALEP